MENTERQDAEDVLSPKDPSSGQSLRQSRWRRRRKCCLVCCGVTTAVVLLLLIILVILIFTVFKEKNPTLHVDSTSLNSVRFNVPTFPNIALTVDAVLDTNLTIYNPNIESFKYKDTTAVVYYHGQQIATSPVSAGKVGAKKNTQMHAQVIVSLSSSDINANLTHDLLVAHVLPLVTTVSIKGTAKLGILMVKNIRVRADCNVQYFILNLTQSFDCSYHVKI